MSQNSGLSNPFASASQSHHFRIEDLCNEPTPLLKQRCQLLDPNNQFPLYCQQPCRLPKLASVFVHVGENGHEDVRFSGNNGILHQLSVGRAQPWWHHASLPAFFPAFSLPNKRAGGKKKEILHGFCRKKTEPNLSRSLCHSRSILMMGLKSGEHQSIWR